MCTNGYDNDGEMMFDNLNECCEYAEFDNGECYYDDVCVESNDEPTPSPSPVPSLPTLITPKPTPACTGCPVPPNPVPVTSPSPTLCTDQPIYWDGIQCTRGKPMGGETPDNIDDLIMFETYDECCLTYALMYLDECPMYDGCNPVSGTPPPSPGIEVLTYAPSSGSTGGSTPTISKETTGPPTLSRNKSDE